ncbi:MAG: putative transposase [Gammaproteobacteria bacterium]
MPEEGRFQRLSTQSKRFIDAIKMIAYRAETAMAYALREQGQLHAVYFGRSTAPRSTFFPTNRKAP